MSKNTQGFAMLMAILLSMSPFSALRAAENNDLAAFVRNVVDTNPTVNAARAALDASAAYEAAASRPLYNPELELEAEDADSETRALGLSQTLDWGGKRRARLAVAEAERRSAMAEYTAVRWQVSVDLLAALANYQTETERNALADDRVRAMQEFAAISRRRFDTGDIGQIELNLAVLALVQARIQQVTAATSVAEFRQSVTNLVSNSPENHWPKISDELPAVAASADGAQELVMALPHVRAAQLLSEAARARVTLRERERRVDPTLTLRGGKEDSETLISVNLTIPLPVRSTPDFSVPRSVLEFHRMPGRTGARRATSVCKAREICCADCGKPES